VIVPDRRREVHAKIRGIEYVIFLRKQIARFSRIVFAGGARDILALALAALQFWRQINEADWVVFVAGDGAAQTEYTFIVAEQTLVAGLVAALHFCRLLLLQSLQTALLVGLGGQSEEVTNEIRYFQFLLPGENIRQG
jgi:hypothetical protein